MSEKFLENLTNFCEKKLRQDYLGEPQILPTLNFINDFLGKNPLCVVYDEIKQLQKKIEEIQNERRDEIDLAIKQKSSSVRLNFKSGEYYFKVNVEIPGNYPVGQVKWSEYSSNLPAVMTSYIDGQAKEIARKCVEPSIGNPIGSFQPQPSFLVTLNFLIDVSSKYCNQICSVCSEVCLPPNPVNVVANDKNPMFIERLICGHLYHQGCLLEYISEPPFKGKLCKAQNCQKPVMHHRWGENVTKAESRWAARESRKRELQDVIDFLK